MVRISQRDLRNHMAKVLDELESAGEAEVTSNNEPVAILSPLNLDPLQRMLRTGQASRPRADKLPHINRVRADRPSEDILDELKSDR